MRPCFLAEPRKSAGDRWNGDVFSVVFGSVKMREGDPEGERGQVAEHLPAISCTSADQSNSPAEIAFIHPTRTSAPLELGSYLDPGV